MLEIIAANLNSILPWAWVLLLPTALLWQQNSKALSSGIENKAFQRRLHWLRENSYGALYLDFLGWLMDSAGKLIGDQIKFEQAYLPLSYAKGPTHKFFGFNPFTALSYERLLRLAFMYPVFAFLIAWAMGSTGELAGSNWLYLLEKSELTPGQRWLKIIGLIAAFLTAIWVSKIPGWPKWVIVNLLFIAAAVLQLSDDQTHWRTVLVGWFFFGLTFTTFYAGGWLTGALFYRSPAKAHQLTHPIATSIAIPISVAIAGVGAITESFAIAGAVVIAVAIVSCGAFAVTIPIAFFIAIAGTGAADVDNAGAEANIIIGIIAVTAAGSVTALLHILEKRIVALSLIHWFWITYTLLFLILGYMSLYHAKDTFSMVLLLFWLILPLVNAPLDWLSFGVTRGLLQAIRSGHHKSLSTLGFAAADLLLALLFLFLITAVLVGVTTLGNAVSGKQLVDIQGTLMGMTEEKARAPNNWWIYFMLLSTLIPTLIHFALAGSAATLWAPRQWRLKLANELEFDTDKKFWANAYLTFMPLFGFVLIPSTLLYSLWWLVTTNGSALGKILLYWAGLLAGCGGVCGGT